MNAPGTVKWSALLALVALLPALLSAQPSASDPIKFRVQLVWGTDDSTPDDPDIKPIEPELKEKLCGVFKWTHYYEVSRKEVSLVAGVSQRVKLSPKCEIEIERSRRAKLEVTLYGDGNKVVTHRQPFVPGELFMFGGPSPHKTSWFVVLTPIDEKNDEKNEEKK